MDSKSATNSEASFLGAPTLKSRGCPVLSTEDGDWVCAWCLNRVAHERDRFQYEGKDEFAFANPVGIRFEIITFGQIVGCEESGSPTLEHTWFAGHAWSFCLCARCGHHLGWFYSGLHDFAGLIRDRLRRGQLVRN